MIAVIKPFIALLPILIILTLMIWRHWSAAAAGSAGLVATLLAAWTVFALEPEVANVGTRALHTGVTLLEAGFIAGTILWIIFGALCVYQLQLRTGSIEILRQTLGKVSKEPAIIVILIAWFFALFMEGAAGFGTSIALAAPFLVGFGFAPLQAVTVALIGHSVGVSFGAIGTPVIAQMAVIDVTGIAIARATAIYHLVFGTFMLSAAVYFSQSGKDRRTTFREMPWRWIVFAAMSFVIPMFLIAWFVGPELPTIGGALIGATVFILVLRWSNTKRADVKDEVEREVHAGEAIEKGDVIKAALPYLVVIALILLTRLVPALEELVYHVAFTWQFLEHYEGTFRPLHHPGTLLVVGFFVGGKLQGASWTVIAQSASAAFRQLGRVVVALFAMLAISRLMVHSGMIATLAQAAASVAGGSWPLWAPFVGALGSFVTGSATASNILFSDFQIATATQLELPALQMLGAQGFGAAAGNIISPHNIIAGCATVAIVGEEGNILRRTLWVCLVYTSMGGILALLLAGVIS